MANAKAKSAMIPKFSGEAEEATWWDAHRSEIEAEIRRRMKQDKPLPLDNLLRGRKPSQPVTLRILKEDLETARRLAAQKGLGYQTYIKMLLREVLAKSEDAGTADGVRRSGSYRQPQRFKAIGGAGHEFRFQSYNPYEALYPGLRVVSRETLHLIKTLRSQGCSVAVEPDDGTKLNYWVEKGVREILSDPVCVFLIGIPLNLTLSLIANWLSQRKRPAGPNEVSLILEFDEDGNKVRYSQTGDPISDARFRSILSALDARKRRFENSKKLTSPYPGYFIPIHLEHTEKVVGWSKGLIFNDREKSIGVIARICDDETWDRIQRGELKGFSHAGIVPSATCLVCKEEYVDCNHIAGVKYDGEECLVRYTVLPAEISVVKDPINPGARIERA